MMEMPIHSHEKITITSYLRDGSRGVTTVHDPGHGATETDIKQQIDAFMSQAKSKKKHFQSHHNVSHFIFNWKGKLYKRYL